MAFHRPYDDAAHLDRYAPYGRADRVGRDATIDEDPLDPAVADDGRTRPRRDGGRVAEMVRRGVADEDHVGCLELVGLERRVRGLRQERVDQHAEARPGDVVAGDA